MKNKLITLAEHETFETKRLILRKIDIEDAADIFEYASDEEVARYVTWQPHKNLEETRQTIAAYFIPNRLYTWGIVEKASNKLIGAIDFRLKEQLAEFGWVLNRQFWGKGYMPEAASILIRFCFEELDLEVVCAKHHQANYKSGRVMEKVGMQHLGQIYETIKKHPEPFLEDYWALTRSDYKKEAADEITNA